MLLNEEADRTISQTPLDIHKHPLTFTNTP